MTGAQGMMEDDDLAAIRVAVHTYLDGLYEGDTDKLASVFHPTSALTQFSDGQLRITPRDAWLDAVRNRPSPRAAGLARHDRILTIDLAGPGMAHVKLACAIPPRFFTDMLSFLKIDGRWQIAQKVFMTETRA
jgi:hypothetical protein